MLGLACQVALAQTGMDPGFGEHGWQALDLAAGVEDRAYAACEQADGRLLVVGARGEGVKELQQRLKALGLYAGARPERVGTLVMYLNTPARGGGTAFPDAGVEVGAMRGNAVFFSYDRPHAVTRTLHAGLPVIEGEKWVATKWLREREFR